MSLPSTGLQSMAGANENSALKVVGLSKKFGQVTALDNVNIDIPKRSFVSLLGPSGCGKSTLLALMAGLEKPSSGSVFVHGKELREPNSAAGMVFQKDLLLEWKTALENILFQFEIRGLPSAPHVARATSLLELVGLGAFAGAYPHQLSGGMRQRVALCRALVHEPELLLMDEPFGALDAITREKVAIDLENITANSEKTVVFVTHSLEEAVFLGDVVLVLSARPGRITTRIDVDVPRPRREWPRGVSVFTPYIDRAFAALKEAGAYDHAAV
ncbi:MAG: ABC transporter ATP-binding protein [Pseudomonadota bacterium]